MLRINASHIKNECHMCKESCTIVINAIHVKSNAYVVLVDKNSPLFNIVRCTEERGSDNYLIETEGEQLTMSYLYTCNIHIHVYVHTPAYIKNVEMEEGNTDKQYMQQSS